MKRLVEYSLDQDGGVLVKVDELSAGPVMRQLGTEFGVQLSAQTGAVIAPAAAEANFMVPTIWRRHGADDG